MKVYKISDGSTLERESVDARELVAGGEYTFNNPGAKPGDSPAETAGEVLARSAREQKEETERYHHGQQSTAVRDAVKMEEVHPAAKARKAAAEARERATEAQRLFAITPTNTNLKAEAEGADKRAKEAEAAADKAQKDSDAADAALRKQSDAEKAAAGKGAKKEAVKKEEAVDYEAMSKADLQELLDKKDIGWNAADTKADLISRLP